MSKLAHTQEHEYYKNILLKLWAFPEYQISCINAPMNDLQMNPFVSSMKNKAHCSALGP